ncbi:FAD-dependent monooxygenase [Actinocrispum wychmicini]|uniref:2-polyprenyl-6-methoxyphenol hydroxylase-like FAD-dependent oxidoreductase n=1 Tax=Actinocrispum wychmicini TaxID=1213861 RepID=A0A4R2IMQ7_9PSEU|nr:FAD-dependent monooxygenase [Actinocrispum wychmicini]TCO45238.1 2-polyprenyl-6-methoxyphenol hydroxylase-like FAD-dependent oxidoreductase [Actinocrispum wychmicini]
MRSRVLIVGAGPTGLALAVELAGAGIHCEVLEKRRERGVLSRAFTLEPRTMELLDLRGRMADFLERGRPCRNPPLGDSDAYLDYGLLDTPFPFSLTIPQYETETLLEKLAVNTGATVRRGAEVTGVRQDEHGVEIDVRTDGGESVERADFLIGCDGVNSTVRAAAGIDFDGRDYEQSTIMADARLRRPPSPPEFARITKRGMVAVFPFKDDTFRIIVFDHQKMMLPADLPLTLKDLNESCEAILGIDIEPYDPIWLSRFRSSQRHAQRYRSGRVILAGDAAHTHIPSGGQGLQTGIQDAMNLGWKLRAELAGWAPPGLLDTYEQERYPIAAETLRKTDLSFRFETSNSLAARVVRRLVVKMMRFKSVQRTNLMHLSGLTLRYPSNDGGKWVGRRVPDRPLVNGPNGCGRIHDLFRDYQFAVLHYRGSVTPLVAGWADRVREAEVEPTGLPELTLVRPDGYIAWAGTADGLQAALRRWCGEPAAH